MRFLAFAFLLIGCAKESREAQAAPTPPPPQTVPAGTPTVRDGGGDAATTSPIAVELAVVPSQLAVADAKDVVVKLTVHNNGAKTIDPQINLSELRVDGAVSKDWNMSLMNSGHPAKWKALPPNDSVSGSVKIGTRLFPKAGDYALVLTVMGVASPEVKVHVTP